MKIVRELEVWSKPGKTLDQDFGHYLAEEIVRDLQLPGDVIAGCSVVFGEDDVSKLKNMLDIEALKIEEFLDFCRSQSLVPDTENITSAGRFLWFHLGRSLVWINLPYDVRGLEYYKKIVKWLAGKDLDLRDGLEDYSIDVNFYKDAPPCWE